ncbi:pentatricopeptide repeat-containing protein [Hibiscus syriacus]|uniref:Pentatricopeptide repeat-containing protein n=1 Tax=Hibiscus syriacus TaxID=106335 RepID=A0A6A3AX56_HIBSY|nr:pentatricopeptide repeat-containing protein [Hibiscus syriacus]
MAQAQQPEEKKKMKDAMATPSARTSNGVSFRFNAHAPEFVPALYNQIPVSGYYYPWFHYHCADATASDWFGDQEPATYMICNRNLSIPMPSFSSRNVLNNDLRQEIIKQVEYLLSDMSLIANESFSKQISRDPEGFVPISFIASTKKIKSLIANQQLLAQILTFSSNLVVSDNGKKVRRKHPFTEKEREEVQSRTVVVENLPDDHSHQNLDKIFDVVGSVKNIRICRPQEFNSSRFRIDFIKSNKLYTLVEYESKEIAEKAVEKLNDKRNWRKGLRVRPLLSLRLSVEDNGVGPKRGWGKGWGRLQTNSGRGFIPSNPQPSNAVQCETSVKHMMKGPRMPDGTRGFTMGRGKRITSPVG